MIGEESSYAEEAKEYPETLDPETASIDPEGEDKLVYEGMGGLDRRAGLGIYSTAGDITLPVDDLATGWFWKWALGNYEVIAPDDDNGEDDNDNGDDGGNGGGDNGGDDGGEDDSGDSGGSTLTESSGKYTHIFSPSTEALMDSFSAKIGKDIFEQVYLGNVIESIELEMEDEWALMTVSTLGAKDKSGTLSDDVEYTDGMLFTAPMASLSKNETDISPSINSLGMTIETGASIEESAGFGSRFPTKAFRGSLLVELELELGFDSPDELITFWGEKDKPSETTIEEVEYTVSLGDNLDFIFPRLVYIGSEQPAEGRDGIVQTVTARALYDDKNKEGPLIISLTNDKESY